MSAVFAVLSGADPGFLKGGGPGTDTRFFTSTPPPWTLSAWRHPTSENLKNTPLLDIHKHPPLDIVRVTSSDLRKFEKHPHSWTFTKGGGSNFGPNVKKPTSWPKRGGPDPLDPPPPWIRHCLYILYIVSQGCGGKGRAYRLVTYPVSAILLHICISEHLCCEHLSF